jgi:hypothetical protein
VSDRVWICTFIFGWPVPAVPAVFAFGMSSVLVGARLVAVWGDLAVAED